MIYLLSTSSAIIRIAWYISPNNIWYTGWFFYLPPCSLFSTGKEKMPTSQLKLTFHEILHLIEPLVGWLDFFSFCTEQWTWESQLKKSTCISLAMNIKLFSSQVFWTQSPLRQLSLWLLPAVHQGAAWAEELSWRTKMEQHFNFRRQRLRCYDVIATFRFV